VGPPHWVLVLGCVLSSVAAPKRKVQQAAPLNQQKTKPQTADKRRNIKGWPLAPLAAPPKAGNMPTGPPIITQSGQETN